MTGIKIQFVNSGGGKIVSPWHLFPRSMMPWEQDVWSKLTINKTWHAICRNQHVSKFLDWLVI